MPDPEVCRPISDHKGTLDKRGRLFHVIDYGCVAGQVVLRNQSGECEW